MEIKQTKPKMTQIKGKWLKLSRFNDFVKDTSIFPIKSPHNKHYSLSLNKDQTFYLKDLVDHLSKINRPLKCILDLSEGTHYTKDDLKATNIEYKKVGIKGKSYPKESDLKEIFETISKYNSKNETICIHCKHGLNRTGYVIVSYLISVKGLESEVAIEYFENARGVKIENKGYVESLLKMDKKERLKEGEAVSASSHSIQN
jgi:atypical dual specificity phosphatase